MDRHPLLPSLLHGRVVVILRGLRREEAVPFADILADAGFRFLEVPLNTPDALEMIEALSDHFRGGNVHIGAGTVLSAGQVDAVAAAGGEYIVSPNVRAETIRRAVAAGLLSMPGFRTPTEAFEALEAGASALKLFPCESPREVTILKSVIAAPIFAVGGIDADNARTYLHVADGVGVGMGVFRPGMDAEALTVSARNFSRMVPIS